MRKLNLKVILALSVTIPATTHAAPTPAQRCEADVELASAKFTQCRLTAEAKYSKSLDADKRTSALARCSEKLQQSFAKAVVRYGLNCTSVPVAEFDAYLKQCSDDAAAAAAGAALPDYVGDLAACDADLTTCNGGLTTCTVDLATCEGGLAICNADLATSETDLATCEATLGSCDSDLTTCNAGRTACEGSLATCAADLAIAEADLAACEGGQLARLLKTGQTTSYGAGSDGDLQLGVEPGFVDNGDGTITDTKTGLMWEKKSNDGSIHDQYNVYTWGINAPPYTMNGTAVTTFLATLNAGGGFAGHTDWRIPNLTELESIRNLEATFPAVFPVFNTGCVPGCTVLTCSCTGLLRHWSSTTYAIQPQSVFAVGYSSGEALSTDKSDMTAVRAVRGGS